MPSGKTWYRRPSKPGRHPLPGNDLLQVTCFPAFQTGTSTGLNTSLVVMSISILPTSLSHQSKSDSFSETHFIQFCTHGDIGPSPTHLNMYHPGE